MATRIALLSVTEPLVAGRATHLPHLHVPNKNRTLDARTRQSLPVVAPRHAVNDAILPGQSLTEFHRDRVPDLDGRIEGGRGHHSGVRRADGAPENRLSVPRLARELLLLLLHVVKADASVGERADRASRVRNEEKALRGGGRVGEGRREREGRIQSRECVGTYM